MGTLYFCKRAMLLTLSACFFLITSQAIFSSGFNGRVVDPLDQNAWNDLEAKSFQLDEEYKNILPVFPFSNSLMPCAKGAECKSAENPLNPPSLEEISDFQDLSQPNFQAAKAEQERVAFCCW